MNPKNSLNAFALWPGVIAIVALILVVVILVVGNQSFKASEETTLTEFNHRQLVMAKEATGGIELYFETLNRAMKAIGRSPGVTRFDEPTIRRILAFELQELGWLGVNDIGVMDAKGVVRYNAAAHQLEGVDFSWRSYFQEAKKLTSDNTYIVEFIEFKGVEAGQRGIIIAVPMFGPISENGYLADEFEGLVLCTLKLDALTQKFVAPIKSSDGGHAFLIENGHDVLWSPDATLFGKNLFNEVAGFPSLQHILKSMIRGKSGTGEFSYYKFDESESRFTDDKEKKLIAYVPVRLGEELWSLGVWAPKKDARKLIRSVYVKQLFLVSLIILATIIGATFTVAMAYRYNKSLEMEVEEKTREFKESHQRLLTVLDSMEAAVYVADIKSYEILFVNRYLNNLFGHVVGKICWQTLQTGQSGPCDFCTNDKLIAADGSPTGVYAREFQNSITSKWYKIHDRAIRWVDGRMVRLEIAVDITDRKQVENELRRAHHEMGTFCRIIKEIGVQQTLDGVGSFLMKELNNILDKHDMLIFVFSDDRDILFKLTEKETKVIKDPAIVHTTATKLADLNGITISPKEIFKSPLVPDDFPSKGRQTIIPFQLQSQTDGALVIACEPDCRCQEKELDLVALILEQASGAIKRAALHEQEIRTLQSRIKSTAEYSGIIGKDPKMQVIYKLIDDIAPTDATVLIEGESGTGKELVAHAIHRRSLRKNQPFVVINCSAYPATLLESELFGHEKGAFTGAIRQKSGRFEQAHGGTVFLDEIGEIAPSAQIKLLRVLQSQSFERLGGEKTLSVDVRILAATNRDLLKEVKNGNFREDLFYRLHVIPIHLPPLRERRNDIPLLTRHFERKFASEQGEKIQDFSSEVMRCLLDYTWPGNVRELENSIEHAVVLSKGSRIEVSHLPSGLCQVQSQAQVISERTILENEKRLLSEVLEECDWNKSQAAVRLGISRSTLYDKIKKYQVSKSRTN